MSIQIIPNGFRRGCGEVTASSFVAVKIRAFFSCRRPTLECEGSNDSNACAASPQLSMFEFEL